MKAKLYVSLVPLFIGLAVGLQAEPVGTGFIYQGRLNDGGNPATGNYDLLFTLNDAVTNGNPAGPAQTNAAVTVSNGVFTVTLDFGDAAFNGDARWLEIA